MNTMIRKALSVLVLLTVLIPGHGQKSVDNLLWNNVDISGRPMAVFSLLVDSNGKAWIGTNNGLYGYDGFEAVAVCPGAEKRAQIYSIVEYDGKLYAGTNNGLFVYDLSDGSWTAPAGSFPKEIRTMLLDGDRLLIGSLGKTVSYNMTDGTVTDISEGLPHRSVYALVRDRRGVVYAGTFDGLARWNIATNRFEKVPLVGLANDGSNLFVNAIAEDPEGTLWLGTEGALINYDPVREKAVKEPAFSGLNIKSLASDAAGRLLVGTDAGFMLRDKRGTRRSRHDSSDRQSIADDEVWTVMADRHGNIWTGTEKGFSISSSSDAARSKRIDMIVDSRDGNQMYVGLRDSHGDLWLGGSNGLLRIDASGKATSYAPGRKHQLSHKRVRDITEDAEGRVWIATDAGVNRYDRAADRFVAYHITDSTGRYQANWVYSIVDDGDRLLTGSYLGGLHETDKSKFLPAGGTVVADKVTTAENGLTNDLVSHVMLDGDGNKWVLLFRDSGVIRIDGCTGEMSRVEVFDTTGEYPALMNADRQGRVWVACRGGVLVLGSDGSEAGRFSVPMVDSDDYIIAMEPVGDDMWLSTTSGIWKTDGGDSSLAVRPLMLPNKYYTSIFDDSANNKVILGATDELVDVDLDRLRDAGAGQRIRLLHADGKDYFVGDGEVLRFDVPSDSAFQLSISTLDYAPERTAHFSYKILKNPADTVGGWSLLPEGSNVLRFANMSIGNHSVGVRMAVPGSEITYFRLNVLPPWYLSVWAVMFYVLAALASVMLLVLWLRHRATERIRDADRSRAIAEAERRLSFLTDISHDLKTPLSLIIAPVSRLRDEVKDPAEKKSLDMVYDNALKLNNLIHRTVELRSFDAVSDDMLILSRMDAVDFCRSIFGTYRESHAGKHFIFHAPDRHIFIEADAVKLESIVNNLLSNACKYSDDGATISLSVGEKDGRLELIVSDDGMGIPEAEQGLVFQRMYRSPRTAAMREGTGIGLYLIRKYLGLLHGTIELFSRENEGTTFIITLPLAPDAAGEAQVDGTADDDSRPRVLIVEDNAAIADIISGSLADGYRCATAANGRSGLAMALSYSPDLIIVDQMMPAMTGMEMVRRMKDNPRLSTVPVIMLTAADDNATETESVRTGIDVFMPKPFEPKILRARVDQLLLSRRSLRRAVRIEEMSSPKPVEIESVSEKQLMRVSAIIEENMDDPDLNVAALAEKSGIGTKQLYRLVKKYVGDTPVDYIRKMRLRKAAMLLAQHKLTVSEIMYMVGFKTPSYFSKCFQAEYGCTPSEYARHDSAGSES